MKAPRVLDAELLVAAAVVVEDVVAEPDVAGDLYVEIHIPGWDSEERDH